MRNGGVLLLASLAILGLIGGGWLLTNYEPQRVGIIFVTLAAITLLVTLLARPLQSLFGNHAEGETARPLMLGRQAIVGAFLGLVPIVLSFLTPLSIGLPSLSMSLGGKFFVSVFIAPIIEEGFFLFVVPFLLYNVFLRVTKSRGASYVVTFILACAIFAAYHWLAYGASFLVSGAFMGAAVFRAMTLLVVLAMSGMGYSPEKTGSVILATIIMHIEFNAFTFSRALVIAGV